MHGRRTQSPVRTALVAALAVLLPAAAPAQSGDALRTPWGENAVGYNPSVLVRLRVAADSLTAARNVRDG